MILIRTAGLFLVGLLCCCQNAKVSKDAKKFVDSQILIPEDISRIYLGRDTTMSKYCDNAANLVVYKDSMSCASCMISNMYRYDEIIEFSKAMSGTPPLFIFSPRQGYCEDVKYTLSITRFRNPVLLDDKGLFPAANPHIPADSRLHTFLLDRNGKVVLVGDPVNNPPLWELYKTTITQLIENGGTMPELQE